MSRPLLPLVVCLVLFAAPLSANLPMPRSLVLLTSARSAADLRARMVAYADSAKATDRNGAGEALYFAGASHDRAARRDSAIALYREAVALRGAQEEAFALVDALLMRRGEGDVEEAIRILAPMEAHTRGNPDAHVPTRGRLGWATYLAGHVDSAAALFLPVANALTTQLEWRYRIGHVALDRGDPRASVDLLMPVAVRSRGADREVMDMLGQAGKLGQRESGVKTEVLRQLRARDAEEQAMLRAWGATRGQFPARDGFQLGGVVLPARAARGAASPPGAIVVMAREDSLGVYDSLAVSLARAGLAVMLLDPRGSGWSTGASCPLPDAWNGHEEAMQTQVAHDVRDAARALAQATRVDTTRLLVVGVGSSTSIAVEAATFDRRIRALLLVSPAPALVDEAAMLGRLQRLRPPVFLQTAPEDPFSVPMLADALYQVGNRPASRVADAASPGRGAAQFRSDPELMSRFSAWLRSAWPTPRATPPAARRRG